MKSDRQLNFWLLIALALQVDYCFGGITTVPKTYSCLADEGKCCLNDPLSTSAKDGIVQSVCLMTCGKGNLWPYPTGDVHLGSTVLPINLEQIKFAVKNSFVSGSQAASEVLYNAMVSNFQQELIKLLSPKTNKNSKITNSNSITVHAIISNNNIITPSPYNDESYSLSITSSPAANQQTENSKEASSVSSSSSSMTIDITIEANTLFGYRHGLESLSQLIAYDPFTGQGEGKGSLVIAADVKIIQDTPSYPYRGIMIDTSRNFISLSKLQENIRALGYNKMNILHLHLTDTASFPITITRQPNMTRYGAYSDAMIYSPKDISDGLVKYAASYGVMILPEVDAPAHMSAGWQWQQPSTAEPLVVCDDAYGHKGSQQWTSDALEPPSGQLNMVNPQAMAILNDIYGEVIEQFQAPVLYHIGGDEVIVGNDDSYAACYNSSEKGAPILAYLAANGLDRQDSQVFYQLWENFTIQATQMIQTHYKKTQSQTQSKKMATTSGSLQKIHIWGGGGVDSSGVCYNLLSQSNVQSYLPPSLFNIQVWDESSDSISVSLMEQGYDIILSNTDYVYLDCGNAGFSNAGGYWCQPYHEWFHIYQYLADVTEKWQLKKGDKKKAGEGRKAALNGKIFGSETLIWTEMVDDTSISQKLWPRSAALGEALWSDPQDGWYAAADRMLHWRERMVQRGVAAEALQPLWCNQREKGVCSINTGTPQ